MPASEPNWDDRYADLLAAYEAHLASSAPLPENFDQELSSLPDELSHRFTNAKDCLLLLQQTWPSARPLEDLTRKLARRFEIAYELGRGGFGIVFLANDKVLGRTVALKVQRPEASVSTALRNRFVQEARAAARLRHPNIASVYELGNEGELLWIASEYCEGTSLAALIRQHVADYDPMAIAQLIAALADALAYSHQQGVLHRDLKPSNVLLQRGATGEASNQAVERNLMGFTPKLIDFGLAKIQEGQSDETRSGIFWELRPIWRPNRPPARCARLVRPRMFTGWVLSSMS